MSTCRNIYCMIGHFRTEQEMGESALAVTCIEADSPSPVLRQTVLHLY